MPRKRTSAVVAVKEDKHYCVLVATRGTQRQESTSPSLPFCPSACRQCQDRGSFLRPCKSPLSVILAVTRSTFRSRANFVALIFLKSHPVLAPVTCRIFKRIPWKRLGHSRYDHFVRYYYALCFGLIDQQINLKKERQGTAYLNIRS